jgi:hypothetical protein
MQTPFDAAAKALIDAALSTVCDVQLQVPVSPDALYVDALIEPRASPDALLSRGILGLMALAACAIEVFSDTPARFDVQLCFARTLFVGARRRQSYGLWVISPGEPKSAIDHWGLTPRAGWPSGVYSGREHATPSVVVLSQLPRDRSTLLLRLMGSGAALRDAVTEARSLSPDAWERRIINDVLLQMSRDLDRMMRTGSKPSKEMRMRYAELVKINEAERAVMQAAAHAKGQIERAEGKLQGIAEGLSQGLSQGHSLGLREAIVDLCEVLSIALTDEQRASLDALNEAELSTLRDAIKRERRWPR